VYKKTINCPDVTALEKYWITTTTIAIPVTGRGGP
jgi:hypothetical protein